MEEIKLARFVVDDAIRYQRVDSDDNKWFIQLDDGYYDIWDLRHGRPLYIKSKIDFEKALEEAIKIK
jgi:hypothetical protein